MLATQIGSSPFNHLTWTRAGADPDAWVIFRDSQIIAGSELTGLPSGPYKVVDGGVTTWHWTDYTAAGNTIHNYRVEAKVGGNVSSGSPSFDILAYAAGVWVADPWTQSSVLLTGSDNPSLVFGEVSAVYYPLRGSDAVRITQSQRGYEGDQSGRIVNVPQAGGKNARGQYLDLMGMRNHPERTMVVAYANVGFYATLSNIDIQPVRSPEPMWDVSFHFEQQGVALWLAGSSAVSDTLTLLGAYEYEEGVNLAAVTTSSPGVVAVSGAPVYKTVEAIHGVMGWYCPALAGGGSVFYACGAVGMADVYVTPRVSTGVASIVRLQGSGSTLASIVFKTAGDIGINDSAGNNVNGGSTHGTGGWVIDRRLRMTVGWQWTTGSITIVGRIYDPCESSLPIDNFGGTFAVANAPDRVVLGTATSPKGTGYDSLRIYSGVSTWPPPELPGTAAQLVYAIPGGTTTTGTTVAWQMTGATSLNLAYSTTLSGNDPATPTYAGSVTADVNGLGRHALSGLTAGTTYYAKMSTGTGVFIGDLIQWKTMPSTAAFTVKAVIGSCQQNAGGSLTQVGWADALAFAPDLHFHLGDFHYKGGQFGAADDWRASVTNYAGSLTALPGMRQALQRASLYLMADDHEFSGNNGDSKEGSVDANGQPTGLRRAQSIYAMQQAFAMYPLADTAAPVSKRGLYGTFMIGSHVRVIMLDGETLDRSLGQDADVPGTPPPKTFAGTAQDAWLRTVLAGPAVAVNLIFCGKALLGSATTSVKMQDKPTAYSNWRAALATWIGANTQTGGTAIKVAWIGGDRHANAYVTKASNPVMTGHPAVLASGWEQHALNLETGETWTNSYGYSLPALPVVGQYIRMTVVDNGTNTVTITWAERHAVTYRTASDGVTTNGSRTVTSAAGAAFTAADVGQGIFGTGIPADAVISTYNSATSVTISAAATATGSSIALSIVNPPTGWNVVAGFTATDTWTY